MRIRILCRLWQLFYNYLEVSIIKLKGWRKSTGRFQTWTFLHFIRIAFRVLIPVYIFYPLTISFSNYTTKFFKFLSKVLKFLQGKGVGEQDDDFESRNWLIFTKRGPKIDKWLFWTTIWFGLGLLLSYGAFLFIYFQFNFRRQTVIWVSVPLFFIGTLGFTFFTKVRVVILLTIPTLVSNKARYVLLAYVLLLAIESPLDNAAVNLNDAVRSLACSTGLAQEQAQKAKKEAADRLGEMFAWVRNVLAFFQEIYREIKRVGDQMKAIMKLLNSFVKKIGNWLRFMNAVKHSLLLFTVYFFIFTESLFLLLHFFCRTAGKH